MRRGFGLIGALVTVIVLVVVGAIAYNIGWSEGVNTHLPAAAQGGRSVGSREHGETTVFEVVADELHDPRLVINDKDGRHGDHPRFGHRS